jgi:methyl-accepting chemotaxis protein
MHEFFQKYGMALAAVSILVGIGLRSVLVYWSKWKKLIAELTRVQTEFERLTKDKRHINLEELEQLSEFMKKSYVFKHPWSAFEATLIQENHEGTVEIYTTQPLSDFIAAQDLLDEHLSAKSFEKAPALVTSLGLAFTFTFIVIGLSHLKPLPTGKIEGIAELIEGLSAKFLSSITALLVSVLLTVAEDYFNQKFEDQFRRLIVVFEQKFRKQRSEDYLSRIDKNMFDLNETMKAVGAGITDAVSKIADTAAGGPMGDFQAIGDAIEKLAITIGESAERSERTTQELEKLVAALGELAKEEEKSSGGAAGTMEEGLLAVMDLVEKHTHRQKDSVDKILELLNKFDAAMGPYQTQKKERLMDHLKKLRPVH